MEKLQRYWLQHMYNHQTHMVTDPENPERGEWVKAVDADTVIKNLEVQLGEARADVVRMAQARIGEHCEHHKLPLTTLEYHALRECPLCWKACAEQLEAQLKALTVAGPSAEGE